MLLIDLFHFLSESHMMEQEEQPTELPSIGDRNPQKRKLEISVGL